MPTAAALPSSSSSFIGFSLPHIHVTPGKAIVFLCFLLVGLTIRAGLRKILRRSANQRTSPQTRHLMGLLASLIPNVFFGFALVMGLDGIGIHLSWLAGILGILGIGVGIGLQTLAANYIALIVILFEDSVRIGDVIEVDGVVGTVAEIRPRASTVMSQDNVAMIVPNALLLSNKVINWSHRDPKMRCHLKVSVNPDPATMGQVIGTLVQIALGHGEVLADPPPEVFVSFGSYSFDMDLAFWISDPARRPSILSDLHVRVAEAFRMEGIRMPYPAQTVILKRDRRGEGERNPEPEEALPVESGI